MAKKLLLSLAVLVLALCAAELANRVRLSRSGRPYDSGLVESALQRFVSRSGPVASGFGARRTVGIDERSRVTGLHPYTGAQAAADPYHVFARFHAERPVEEYWILVVGGSVAEELVLGYGQEIAAEIASDARFAGRRVRVLNHAHWAYKQPQQLARVALLACLGYVPDAVINLDGFNESAISAENVGQGTHPLYPAYPQWGYLVEGIGSGDRAQADLLLATWREREESLPLARATLRFGLCRSSLWGGLAIAHIRAASSRQARLQEQLAERGRELRGPETDRRQSAGPEWGSDHEAGLELAITGWFESSVSLAALCAAHSIPYVHILQPTLHDAGSKPLGAKERGLVPPNGGFGPAVARGYPRLRERGLELLRRGIAFHDATRVFADEPRDLYYDECHVGLEGNRILATEVVRAFLAHAPDRIAARAPSAAGSATEGASPPR